MLSVRLENFHVLENATSLLAQIANEADLKFTPSEFSIISSQSHHSLPFVATLQLTHRFFINYSVDHSHSATISLQSFHQALLDGASFSSLTINLFEAISLTFESSRDLPQLHHDLISSPSQGEDLGQIDRENFFTIRSKDFRRIIMEFSIFQDDSVFVTLTDSQVKFSIASKEIILTKEGGQCLIVGHEGEVETQFQIVLHPMSFFLNLTNKGHWVQFFKTNDSRSVISISVLELYARYVIYFSQR